MTSKRKLRAELLHTKLLLSAWLELSHSNWRYTARRGGENPGDFFATKLQSDTAKVLWP